MHYEQVATDVLSAFGGSKNILASEVQLTRLCLSVADASLVDVGQLENIESVLGITRQDSSFNVVFAPGVVEQVHESLSTMISASAKTQVEHKVDHSRPSMSVQIRPGMKKSYAIQAEALSRILQELPEDDEDTATSPEPVQMQEQAYTKTKGAQLPISTESEPEQTAELSEHRLLVINGPNINLLGMREPGIYGSDNYETLVLLCKTAAQETGFSDCRCFQSNHEGAIVDEIQRAACSYSGIVINPAAYTHTSIAILDALKAVNLPAVEVHISKVEEREDFRQISYVREACFKTITGRGLEGYAEAIRALAEYLKQ